MGELVSGSTVELWLPDQPGERRAGTLRFGPGSNPNVTIMQGWHEAPKVATPAGMSEARMVDSFEPMRPGQVHETFNRPIVLGRATGGGLFALLDVADRAGLMKIGDGSYHEREIIARLLVTGLHPDHEELKVESLTAFHNLLTRTIALEGITKHQSYFPNAPDGAGFDFEYRNPDSLVVRLDRRTKLHIRQEAALVPPEPVGLGRGFEVAPFVRCSAQFEFSKPIPFLDAWSDYLWPFGRLLEFLARSKGGWLSLHLPGHRSVSVHHSPLAEELDPADRRDSRTLFHLNHCGDRTEAVIRDWFKLWWQFEVALHEGLMAGEERYSEQQVRRWASALEGLSHLCEQRIERPLPAGVWSKMKPEFRKILDAHDLDRQLLGSIRDAVDRITLVERLQGVVDDLDAKGAQSPESVSSALPAIKNVRNQSSHTRADQPFGVPEEIREAVDAAERLFFAFVVGQLPLRRQKKVHVMRNIMSSSRFR